MMKKTEISNGVKKIFPIIFLSLLFFSFAASIQAGLVPCGLSEDDIEQPGDQTIPCQLCHLFVMLDGIIDFLLIKIVPSLAALMIAIGGFMYIVAYASPTGGGPEMLSRAKRLFTAVVFGLLIIYGAFLIIGLVLKFIGLADWTTQIYQNWWEQGLFEIPCP